MTSLKTLGFDVNPGGTRLFIVQAVALGLAVLTCGLRVYVRAVMVRDMLMEDWMMLLSTIVYIPYSVIVLHSIAIGGTGLHTKQLTREGIMVALRAWYLGEVLYAPLGTLIRLSIAFYLLRIAVKTWHVWIIRINIAVILVSNVAYFFVCLIQCTPPSFFWEGPARVPGAHGKCIHKAIVPISSIVQCGLSTLSDWTLALLPIAILWDVNINRRTKATVAVLLSFGLVAGIAVILKAIYVKSIAISPDFLHDTVDVATWSVLEPALGIIAGCVATLRPLFVGFGIGPKWSKKFGNKKKGGSGGSGGAANQPRSNHYRNMRRLHDKDSVDGAGDIEFASVDRSKSGAMSMSTTTTTTTTNKTNKTTTPAAPIVHGRSRSRSNSSSNSSIPTTIYRPDTRGSETKLTKTPASTNTFPKMSTSSTTSANSGIIFQNLDAFGNSRSQHCEIESSHRPPREDGVVELMPGNGINVHTTFAISSSSQHQHQHQHQYQHRGMEGEEASNAGAGAGAASSTMTSSSSRDQPRQSSWLLTPPSSRPLGAAAPTMTPAKTGSW